MAPAPAALTTRPPWAVELADRASSGNWDRAIRFVVIALFMLAARAADVPPALAAAFAVLLLLATLAAVLHWYRSIPQFDVFVHLVAPGGLAAVVYLVLVHWRLFPAARDREPSVGYVDTVVDLAAGMVGSAVRHALDLSVAAEAGSTRPLLYAQCSSSAQHAVARASISGWTVTPPG